MNAALVATVDRLRREAEFRRAVADAALWEGLRWRSVGRPRLAGGSDETALIFATDARDLRATARDLLAGAR